MQRRVPAIPPSPPVPEWHCEECRLWTPEPEWRYEEYNVGEDGFFWCWHCPRCGYMHGERPETR